MPASSINGTEVAVIGTPNSSMVIADSSAAMPSTTRSSGNLQDDLVWIGTRSASALWGSRTGQRRADRPRS